MFWGHHMGFGGWGLLLTGLFWIGLIVLGVWLLARLFPKAGSSQAAAHEEGPRGRTWQAPETPLEILKRRYARGEVSKEEYETIRHDLLS